MGKPHKHSSPVKQAEANQPPNAVAPVSGGVGRRAQRPGPRLLEREMSVDRITGFDNRDRDGAKRAPPTERELSHVKLSGAALAASMMNERTTRELIGKLGEDVERCHTNLIQCIDEGDKNSDGTVTADYEHHARQLIRAILAYVEGVTFSVKMWAVAQCL